MINILSWFLIGSVQITFYHDDIICYDHGKYERYCPGNEFPSFNSKYFPKTFIFQNDEITPKNILITKK